MVVVDPSWTEPNAVAKQANDDDDRGGDQTVAIDRPVPTDHDRRGGGKGPAAPTTPRRLRLPQEDKDVHVLLLLLLLRRGGTRTVLRRIPIANIVHSRQTFQ